MPCIALECTVNKTMKLLTYRDQTYDFSEKKIKQIL